MKRIQPEKTLVGRLAALSDGTRLRAMRLLEGHELSVGELSRTLQLPQSTVSRHLKVLQEAEWVARRAEGPASLFRLVLDELSPEARTLWAAVRDQPSTHEVEEDLRRLAAVLSERRTDTRSFFGQNASQWDELREQLFGTRFTAWGLLSLVPPEWTVADLGCGTGNASELLAPLVKRVIALDSSRPMLEGARARLRGRTNVEFVEGSLEETGLRGGSVDCAVCVLVLHHVEDVGGALREMRRIVRPGGVVLVVDMVAHDREDYRRTMGHQHLGFTRAGMTEALRVAGFRAVEWRELPVEPDARGPGLFACRACAGEG